MNLVPFICNDEKTVSLSVLMIDDSTVGVQPGHAQIDSNPLEREDFKRHIPPPFVLVFTVDDSSYSS